MPIDARLRTPRRNWPTAVLDRLSASWMSSISSVSPNYFLIVWDFVRFAREQRHPGHGSWIGRRFARRYALYLSHVCPLKYDLLFERFLDRKPPRDARYRYRLLQGSPRRGDRLRQGTYGTANVAQIGTFGTLAARAAIRDVGRAWD